MPRPYRWSNFLVEVLDFLVPMRRLHPTELAVYLFVIRQTRLLGCRLLRLRTSKVARLLAIQDATLHFNLRRLEQKGCLQVVANERTRFVVAGRMPAEVIRWALRHGVFFPGVQRRFNRGRAARMKRTMLSLQKRRCFYCYKLLTLQRAVCDHVVAVTRGGNPSWENLVVSCRECNQLKQTHSARDFLRMLYRDGYLTRAELEERMLAVRRLRWTYAALAHDPDTGFSKYNPWRHRKKYRKDS
jgi:hypothetical protein